MNEVKSQKTFGETPLSDIDRQNIVKALIAEGFNEEQLNTMTLEKVWNLYLDSVSKTMSDMIGEMSRVLEKNPKLAPMISPTIKKVNRQLTDLVDSLEKELDRKKERRGTSHE
jgi:hypothetical protein